MSKSVYNGETRPSYWHREPSVNPNDNGWRIIGTGDEEEYLNNPENWTITSIDKAFELCPMILEFFDAPVGTELFIQFNGQNMVLEIWDLVENKMIFSVNS